MVRRTFNPDVPVPATVPAVLPAVVSSEWQACDGEAGFGAARHLPAAACLHPLSPPTLTLAVWWARFFARAAVCATPAAV